MGTFWHYRAPLWLQRIRSVQHKVLQLFIFSRIASIFSLGSLFPILRVILENFKLNLILSIVLLHRKLVSAGKRSRASQLSNSSNLKILFFIYQISECREEITSIKSNSPETLPIHMSYWSISLLQPGQFLSIG